MIEFLDKSNSEFADIMRAYDPMAPLIELVERIAPGLTSLDSREGGYQVYCSICNPSFYAIVC